MTGVYPTSPLGLPVVIVERDGAGLVERVGLGHVGRDLAGLVFGVPRHGISVLVEDVGLGRVGGHIEPLVGLIGLIGLVGIAFHTPPYRACSPTAAAGHIDA